VKHKAARIFGAFRDLLINKRRAAIVSRNHRSQHFLHSIDCGMIFVLAVIRHGLACLYCLVIKINLRLLILHISLGGINGEGIISQNFPSKAVLGALFHISIGFLNQERVRDLRGEQNQSVQVSDWFVYNQVVD